MAGRQGGRATRRSRSQLVADAGAGYVRRFPHGFGGRDLRLFLLGGIELHDVEPALADRVLSQPKVTAVLAVLALSPAPMPVRRDRIVGLLWPKLSQERARSALRKAVHVIRAAVGAEVLVNRGDEDLALKVPPFWCDVLELKSAAAQGLMGRTVELYREELMAGFHLSGCAEFDRWLESEREEARECAAAAALGLATAMEADERFTTAGRLAKKAVSFKWDDERVLRRTMKMLARIEDHAGALRLYESFSTRLRAELDALPSPESMQLAESLRQR